MPSTNWPWLLASFNQDLSLASFLRLLAVATAPCLIGGLIGVRSRGVWRVRPVLTGILVGVLAEVVWFFLSGRSHLTWATPLAGAVAAFCVARAVTE